MNEIIEKIAYVPCNAANHGGRRDKSAIKYLVYHYTGNDGDTAMANAKYYAEAKVEASAHYFVDDTSVVQSVGDLTVAWAVGGKKWADCDETGGGTMHGIVTNTNSLSIEMCDTHRDGEIMASPETQENALALGRMLMDRYGIPIENVVRHFDVTGKYCPRYFMDNDKWAAFKARLTDEEDDVKRYNTIQEIEKEAPWAAPTVNKLIANGCLNGTGTGLDLSMDMLRLLVINDRAGCYGA
jgi:N-acetylmuramoyl-L-alanine amidase CwlA